MIDWTKSMRQTFVFRSVSRDTWKETGTIDGVTSCTITRDAGTSTLESATMSIDDSVPGEQYVRVYMVCEQDGDTHYECLGTFLSQSMDETLDGKTITRSVNCASVLQPLVDVLMPIGYFVGPDDDVADVCVSLMREHLHAPIHPVGTFDNVMEPFVAEAEETVLDYVTSLLKKSGMHLMIDPFGAVSFEPDVDAAALGISWEYDDGNSSILLPSVQVGSDWFGMPNVVEVIVSKTSGNLYGCAENDSPNSILSTCSRGRRVVRRETNPGLPDSASQEDADDYALRKLRELSCLERAVRYSHGYNGVSIGSGVSLRYERHEFAVARAMVSEQRIVCDTGCSVEETSTYTDNLWSE